MKKSIILIICLLCLLVSCGDKKNVETDAPETPGVTTPTNDGEDGSQANPENPALATPQRSPEEQVVDKNLITLLKEQLAGAYDVKGATFTFTNTEELEGKECFVYRMTKEGVTELFAVATDGSAIFHMDGMEFVKIFDIE